MSDASLLDRFVKGREQAAFEELVGRYRARVRSACLKILGSEHDADDVVQATFLLLALRAPDRTWEASVGGWLCVVARRLAQHARMSTTSRLRREAGAARLAVEGGTSSRAHAADPVAVLQRVEIQRLVRYELNRLPEKYRAPVVLCDLEGLSHAEAAVRLGLPSGSMSRRLNKARSLLRARLSLSVLALVLLALPIALFRAFEGGRDGLRGPLSKVAGRVEVREASEVLDRLVTLRTTAGAEVVTLPREDAARAAGAFERHARSLAIAGDPRDDSIAELRLAGISLVDAAARDEFSAVVAEARRLDATCTRCHRTSRH